MRRSHFSTYRLLATSVATALLAACGSESTAPAPVVNPGPGNTQLQLDFGFVEAIKDCDGIEGDGDFSFKVTTNVSSGGGCDGLQQVGLAGERRTHGSNRAQGVHRAGDVRTADHRGVRGQ